MIRRNNDIVCTEYGQDIYLLYTKGFTQLYKDGKFVTILGEAHNLEQKAPLSAIGSTIDQLTYVKEMVASIPTLVLTEIPSDESRNVNKIQSINLELFRNYGRGKDHILFSDIRPQVFEITGSHDFYLDIIRRTKSFTDLNDTEWEKIYDKLIKCTKLDCDKYEEQFKKYINNFQTKVEELKELKEKFIEKYDELYARVLSAGDYDYLTQYISNEPSIGIVNLLFFARIMNDITEEDIDLIDLLDQINKSNELFREIQQDVLDINMLCEMYKNNEFKNFVFVVGNNHRENFRQYFLKDGWHQMKNIDGSFNNTINLKGTYNPQTLSGCIRDLVLNQPSLKKQKQES